MTFMPFFSFLSYFLVSFLICSCMIPHSVVSWYLLCICIGRPCTYNYLSLSLQSLHPPLFFLSFLWLYLFWLHHHGHLFLFDVTSTQSFILHTIYFSSILNPHTLPTSSCCIFTSLYPPVVRGILDSDTGSFVQHTYASTVHSSSRVSFPHRTSYTTYNIVNQTTHSILVAYLHYPRVAIITYSSYHYSTTSYDIDVYV
ncbi:hypothetical protein CPB83DRAFT_525324 [Crepidotus variabilis]|uniref:Uncharacterized protein n=1 Tax=Crepidotus variabilis TaxID=179855 RepID=A0A9P6JUK0_9AGAR|nr:hypothetical protein CPB83DRAFT_525324 [Crepidotus variabilis]